MQTGIRKEACWTYSNPFHGFERVTKFQIECITSKPLSKGRWFTVDVISDLSLLDYRINGIKVICTHLDLSHPKAQWLLRNKGSAVARGPVPDL